MTREFGKAILAWIIWTTCSLACVWFLGNYAESIFVVILRLADFPAKGRPFFNSFLQVSLFTLVLLLFLSTRKWAKSPSPRDE